VSLALLGGWLVLATPAYLYSELLPTAEMHKSEDKTAQNRARTVSPDNRPPAFHGVKGSSTQGASESSPVTYSEAYRSLWWQLNGKIPSQRFVQLEDFVDILQRLELDRDRLISLIRILVENHERMDDLKPMLFNEIRSIEAYDGEKKRHLADFPDPPRSFQG